MDRQSIEKQLKHLKEAHKDLEYDLMESDATWNDLESTMIKKRKLQLKEEIVRVEKLLQTQQ